jgi:hypothetical protein
MIYLALPQSSSSWQSYGAASAVGFEGTMGPTNPNNPGEGGVDYDDECIDALWTIINDESRQTEAGEISWLSTSVRTCEFLYSLSVCFFFCQSTLAGNAFRCRWCV